jgi:uncharacterized protein
MNDIIDIHCHYSGSVEELNELISIQNEIGIKRTVLVSGNMLHSISLGDYLRGTHDGVDLIPNNNILEQVCKNHDERFISFFTYDPNYHLVSEIENKIGVTFKGIKLNPVIHNISFKDKYLMELLELAKEKQCPIYSHITLNQDSDLDSFCYLAQEFKELNFIIGHMGFSTFDESAIKSAQKYDNVFLESSIGSIKAFKHVKHNGLHEKLVYGSEYPLHHPKIELDKLKLIFNERELERILSLNAIELLRI